MNYPLFIYAAKISFSIVSRYDKLSKKLAKTYYFLSPYPIQKWLNHHNQL